MSLTAQSERPESLRATPGSCPPGILLPVLKGSLPFSGAAVRCAFLALLLLAEVLWLTWRFDTDTLQQGEGFWHTFFQWAPRLLALGIAVVAAALVLRRQQLRAGLSALLAAASAHRRWPIWLCCQLLSFASLISLSQRIYEFPGDVPGFNGTAAAWLALVILSVFCGVASTASPMWWLKLVRQEWKLGLTMLLAGMAIGGAGLLTRSLWLGLSFLTFHIVGHLLSWIYPEIVLDSATRSIGTPQFWVEIAPQCSGYEGIGLIIVLLGVFFYSCRDRLRFPHAFLLWPVGVALIFLCNALRISALIAIGSSYSPELALGGFHAQAGWLFFNAVGLGMVALGLRVPWLLRDFSESRPQEDSSSPVSGYLVPFLVVVLLNLLLPAVLEESDLLYPVKVIAAFGTLFLFRHQIQPLTWRFSWSGLAVGALVYAVWIVATFWEADRTVSAPTALEMLPAGWLAVWMVFRVLGAIVTVPIIEELAFRGYLMRRIDSPEFTEQDYSRCTGKAIILSSLLFGVTHGFWFAGILAGLMYGLLTVRRNNLGDAILAHAVTNALIALTVLTTDAWWLW